MEISKEKLEFLFGLVQFYGETVECLRNLCDEEKCILRKKRNNKDELKDLIFIKKQKTYIELALKAVATELEEKHGCCMPGVIGWRTSDQDRFFQDPLFSGSKGADCCCPKPKP